MQYDVILKANKMMVFFPYLQMVRLIDTSLLSIKNTFNVTHLLIQIGNKSIAYLGINRMHAWHQVPASKEHFYSLQ